MASDLIGRQFGKLTVINDLGGDGLQCQCDCEREGTYPRAITKPSYRGPKACPWCLGTPCEECGTIIPNKGRMPSKTCSETCRTARANRREKERYQRIKNTNHFKETRAAYLFKLAQAMEDDPEFAASVREDHRRAVREWRERQMADPISRARYLKANREREAKRLERIRSRPEEYAEHLRKQRDWYHSLSDEDYLRIYKAPKTLKYKDGTKEERQFIADHYPTHTAIWIAEMLGRSESFVRKVIQILGLSRVMPEAKNRAEWNEASIKMLGKKSDRDVARELGISFQAVSKKRKSLGILRYQKNSKKPRD